MATSSSGGRPGFPRIPWRASTASPGIARERKVLGDDVAIEVDAYDEMNTKVPIDKHRSARSSSRAMTGSSASSACNRTSIPRAMAIARQFRARGVKVAIGGFHVSGMLVDAERADARARGGASSSASPSSRAKRRSISRRSSRTFMPAARSRSTTTCTTCPIFNSRPSLICRGGSCERYDGITIVLRCRARLSLPMLLLHHHQCAGPEIALARRR